MKRFSAVLSTCLWMSAPAAFAQVVEADAAAAAVKASVARYKQEAAFRGKLKEMGLVYKRYCSFAANAILDNGYYQVEFVNPAAASGGYAVIKVWYHPRDREAFGYDYIPLLRIAGDPRAAEVELRSSSIADFMARTRDLAVLKAKIEELKQTVGPVVAAEDDRGGCDGEGLRPVPIETR